MKANELRIGNLFDFTADGNGYLPVEEIRKNDEGFKGYYAVFRNGSFKWLIETDGEWNIQPIPLTEEWLLKFGFKHGNNSPYGSALGKRGVYLGCLHGGRFCFNAESSTNKSAYIEYVHQLQNLYFALTGEELQLQTK